MNIYRQWCPDFIKKMKNRVMTAYFRYGPINNVRLCDFSNFAIRKIKKYQETGNLEYIVDAGVYCMLEYAFPGHLNAYFKPDCRESADPIERVWD